MKKHIVTLLAVFVLISCKKAETAPQENRNNGLISITKEQFQSGEMEIAQPTLQEFNVTVKASGKIDVPPQNRAKINTFLGGYVKSTSLLVGDKVQKGQALVTLENTDFIDLQKEYLEVAEQINYLKSEFERQKTLYNEKIASEKNYLKAESDYRKTKALYNGLRAKLLLLNINPSNVEKGKFTSTITIYAPISGDIVVMNVNKGTYISPSDVILEIVQINHLHLELAVFEKDILSIKEGQDIKFTVPEATKEMYDAKVHLVGKSIEGKDRTINVHGHLSDAVKQKLLTGMFVEAQIIVDSKKGLAIPKEALIIENNKYFVLLMQNDKNNIYTFKKIGIEIGETSEKQVEIIPNALINSNSKLLIKGVFDVTD